MEGSKRATQTWLVGPPDARKRACPVRGALGGNLLLQGSKAPSFDSMQAAAAEPPPSRSAAIGRAPVRGWWGREEAVHGQSTAAPVPTAVPPWGGGEEREGAASVRARCRADGGPECGLAAPRAAAQTGIP